MLGPNGAGGSTTVEIIEGHRWRGRGARRRSRTAHPAVAGPHRDRAADVGAMAARFTTNRQPLGVQLVSAGLHDRPAIWPALS
jgi:ABC-type molybdenum transport system ATPase subunit/photorepair protein PhrA